MSDMQKENRMGTQPVNGLILRMSFPPILSMIVGAFYNIIESLFVARVSDHALAAVTLVLPIQMLIISVGVGTGVGVSSLIARRLGEKRQDDADSASTHGFIIIAINWVIFVVFGLFFADDFLALFTKDTYIYENALIFCQIVTIGSLFPFTAILVERILQATGNVLFPMIFNLVGGILNIIVAPILILGWFGFPALGVKGAGIAVVICQGTATVVALFLLFGFKHHVKVKLRGFRTKKQAFVDIYAVGIPSMVMMSVGSVMTAALNAILIVYSEAAVAILGIYYRINSFVFMPVFGLNQGSLPVMAYNFGARNRDRLVTAYTFSLKIATGIMLIGTIAVFIFSPQIMQLFSATPEMFTLGVPAMRIFAIAFIFSGYCIVTATLFQALAHGVFSMITSLLRQIIIVIPLTYILLKLFGITPAWFSFPISEFVAAILTIVFYRYVYKKDIRIL